MTPAPNRRCFPPVSQKIEPVIPTRNEVKRGIPHGLQGSDNVFFAPDVLIQVPANHYQPEG